jgi:hypothetical protein
MRAALAAHKVTDQYTLLTAMLCSERAITKEKWASGYKHVNLNPLDKLPTDIFISNMHEHVLASGQTQTALQMNIVLTDADLRWHQGITHLGSIKLPEFYAQLEVSDKRCLMNALRDPAFSWSASDQLALKPCLSKQVYAKLIAGKNVYNMHKFVMSMAEATRYGVADATHLEPNWTRPELQSERLTRFKEGIAATQPPKGGGSNRFGASSAHTLESYTLKRLPSESNDTFFKRLCLMKSREGYATPSVHVEMSSQQRALLAPTANDLAVGNLLREANESKGERFGARRMNML